MIKLRAILLGSIALAIVSVAMEVGAQLSPKEQAEAHFAKWQRRVDDLSKEIVNESSSVPDVDRSLYLTLLAKISWEINETDARAYLKTASAKMLSGLRSDDKTDLPKKVKLAQRVIDIVASLDDQLAQDLVLQVVAAVDDGSDGNNRRENPEMAELYVNLGLQVVTKKPELALACGTTSLGYGVANSLPRLIAELNRHGSARAESLLGKTMTKVHGNYSSSRLLFLVNFTKYLFAVWGDYGFSATQRTGFLNKFIDVILAAALVESEQSSRCRIANYVPAVLQFIDAHVPNQSQAVRQSLQTCIPHVSGSQREVLRAPAKLDQPQNVDDFVREAIKTPDLELKVKYWRTALSKIENDKKFAEMISLLDDVNGDDLKKAAPIVWSDWRTDAAFQFAVASLEAKDLPAVYRIIEQTPMPLRSEVRMRLAKKLKTENDTSFFLENLDGLQKELGALDIASKDAARFYRTLSDLYLRTRPIEAEVMFRNAVKYINKTDADNPDFISDKDWAPRLDSVPMSAKLLDFDEIGISNALNTLSSRRSRVRLKLGLLESSFKEYVEAKKKLNAFKTTKTRPEKPARNLLMSLSRN